MSGALTIATTDYDHFRGFRFGLVRAEGIEVNWLTLGHHEIFSRFTFNREWDVSELSFAKFSAQVTRKSGSTTPSSSAAVATTILNVEPGE